MKRPHVLASAAVSIDGFLDDASPRRLVLSGPADLDRVDAERAGVDAILVGAGTVRDDNPRLLVRDPTLREQRRARGLAESPTKVTMTRKARLDADSNFFATGDSEKIVYCATPSLSAARSRLAHVATVVDGGRDVRVERLSEDLYDRGVRRLMVEGGGRVHTQFLTSAAADELHLVVAPFFVGSSQARRFVGDGAFPWNPGHRARLAETQQIGDVVLLRYALSRRFEEAG
jgi:5-amino-6-(5-phosphoribosylamino)uracil reductase